VVIRHTLTLEPFANSFPLLSLSDLRQGASKVVERAGDEDGFGGGGVVPTKWATILHFFPSEARSFLNASSKVFGE
jgi:hypothetical protein